MMGFEFEGQLSESGAGDREDWAAARINQSSES